LVHKLSTCPFGVIRLSIENPPVSRSGQIWYLTQQKPAVRLMHALMLKEVKDINFISIKQKKKSYSWLAKCWIAVVEKKLKVVILPLVVVKYCWQPFGGLFKNHVEIVAFKNIFKIIPIQVAAFNLSYFNFPISGSWCSSKCERNGGRVGWAFSYVYINCKSNC